MEASLKTTSEVNEDNRIISVIIPCHNAAETLGGTLEALKHQTVSWKRLDVIVSDDGSDDGSTEIAEKYGVRVIRGTSRKGPAAARNRGWAEAKGEIVLFTDADCIPQSDWVEYMIEPFCDPEVMGVKGSYLTKQRELTARFVQYEYEDKYKRMAAFKEIDFIDTYSAGFRRFLLEETGGFDESFPGASVEDQEFSFRVWEKGYKMVFQPHARVYHRHASTLKDYLKKKFRIGYWKVKLLLSHPQKTYKDTHTPQSLKLHMGLFALLLFGLLLNLFVTSARWPLFGCFLFYLISTVPMSAGIFLRDPAVGLLTPVFIAVRSLGLGTGLAAGLLRFGLRRSNGEAP